ncbi:MAG: Bug family tripartite tricarboxylate transporter substrate binding protein [Alphaproteobacteria bacterium]
MTGIRASATAMLAGFAALLAVPAAAQDNFYAGKSLNLVAGFPPGGGVDGEMRVVSRHFARFIPGNPTIVAKNMPGAGGIVLGNHLYNVADKDGLTVGMPGRSGFLLSNVVKEKNVNFDLAKFDYIGGAGSTNSILWVRSDSGINSVADLKSAKNEIVLGAWSQRSQNAIVPKVLQKYEGWPFKVVHGYPGTNEVLIAVERGEIQGLYSHEGSIANTRPDLISSGKLKAVFQTFEDMPNVPIMSDLVSNPKEKALLALLNAPSQVGLPLMAPPGIPKDRLAILRSSYAKMVEDKAYREEAEKRGLPVGRAMTGEQLQKLIAENLSSVQEEVLQEYLSYMDDKGGK